MSFVKCSGPIDRQANFGSGLWLRLAALGSGGSGCASAALPVGLLLAGPLAVLLASADAGERASDQTKTCNLSH